MDVDLLSRIQFGLIIAFHSIFSTLYIGLALYLAVVEYPPAPCSIARYYRKYRFCVRIFAIYYVFRLSAASSRSLNSGHIPPGFHRQRPRFSSRSRTSFLFYRYRVFQGV